MTEVHVSLNVSGTSQFDFSITNVTRPNMSFRRIVVRMIYKIQIHIPFGHFRYKHN